MKNIFFTLLLLVTTLATTQVLYGQQGETFRHIVQKGETLYQLSNTYNLTIDQIFDYNPYLRVDILEIGDTLVLPESPKVVEEFPPRTPTPSVPKVDEKESIIHIVEEKETLYSLSRRYEVPVKNILAYNPFIDKNVIGVSDTLVIPLNILVDKEPTPKPKTQGGRSSTPEPSTIEGNVFHIIGQGETLYGISKRYEIPLEKLIESNPHLDVSVIGIGDTILLSADEQALSILKSSEKGEGSNEINDPINEEIPDSLATKSTNPADTIQQITHIVSPGETLYSISKKYESSIADLVRWNDLTEDDLPLGKELIVQVLNQKEMEEGEDKYVTVHEVDYSKMKPIKHKTKAGETLKSLATQYNQRIEILKEWNELEDKDPLPAEVIIGWYIPSPKTKDSVKPIVTAAEQEQDFRRGYMSRNQNQLQYRMVYGKGKGTWLKDNTSFDKNFYALHKTAPPQSYIRVVNPMNKKTVYVKVIGKLPNTGANEDVELKLTYAAVQQLNLRDGKFLLEWSYHVPK